VNRNELEAHYRGYIDCLNRQAWPELGRFVHIDAAHNGRPFGLAGYRAMLEDDFRRIPDLSFTVLRLVCEPPHVACRLTFDCHPAGEFLGLNVNGRRVRFIEHVFYRFEDGLIADVWSILDREAIAAQLEAG
jgi:predicted ester cyclase